MVQIKYLAAAAVFYILALLQDSFFAHFNLWGAVPNLVFIFFVLACFFEEKNKFYPIIFYAFVAGLLLDISSVYFLGASVFLLIAIGFLIKRVQLLLFERSNYPLPYFLLLFYASYTLYSTLYAWPPTLPQITPELAGSAIYNFVFAFFIFTVYKKIFWRMADNRQLSLFKRL